ncbi:MAG TPA: thiamine pyrophosphate-binding protein [Trebonia sp.]|jgi:thiamine pyrophosphate-dependent acetolactate synthase large subunit-like protein
MKLHSALALGLMDHGIGTVFGLAGDGNLFFADSFAREHGGTFVSAVHEAGATMMAYGYGAVSGALGVVTVTHGPGLTNTVTGLYEAAKARMPLLLVCGDTAAADRYGPQNIAQRELIIPTGAGFEQVRSPETATVDLATAIRRALVERRPVALNVPAEFMHTEVGYEPVRQSLIVRPSPRPEEADLDRAVGIIAGARRPIVLAGRGAIGARAALLQLAERIGAPVATTLGAKDLFRGEPYDLGIFGTLAGPSALGAIYQADCVLAFGAGLNRFTTAEGSLLEGKRIVHCDTDPTRLGNYARVDTAVFGDAAQTASVITDWLDEAGIAPSSFRSPALAGQLAAPSARDGEQETGGRAARRPGTIDLKSALTRIDQAVPSDRVFVTDAGRYINESWTRVHVQDPGAFVFTVNFGSIGLGMGAAVGAAYAAPGRPVLMVCGDGGFMLGGLAEFNSAVRHGLDLIVVVCDDGAYGAEHVQLVTQGVPPAIAEFGWPDFAQVADALGGQGVTVRGEEDLDRALKLIAGRDRPLLIDLKLDPYQMGDVQH